MARSERVSGRYAGSFARSSIRAGHRWDSSWVLPTGRTPCAEGVRLYRALATFARILRRRGFPGVLRSRKRFWNQHLSVRLIQIAQSSKYLNAYLKLRALRRTIGG